MIVEEDRERLGAGEQQLQDMPSIAGLLYLIVLERQEIAEYMASDITGVGHKKMGHAVALSR